MSASLLLSNVSYILNSLQGLLEHNVRLQVEVEELRRQLADKQELLAAAAEAIDVLEQQVMAQINISLTVFLSLL